MRNSLLILILGLTLAGSSLRTAPENDLPSQYGNQVAPADLKEYLTIIASDALEGRRTGTRGQKMAAAFIASQFQEIGLAGPVDGSYYQPVNLFSSTPSVVFIKVGGTRFENFTEFFYTGSTDTQGEVRAEAVFVGHGDDDDYAQVDVKDKVAVLLIGELGPIASMRLVVQHARVKGAKAVFVVSE